MSGITEDNFRQKELRQWEKGQKTIDLQEEFRQRNQDLIKNYGRDNYTYTPELYEASHRYWNENEARFAHGYPATAWLKLGILYGVRL